MMYIIEEPDCTLYDSGNREVFIHLFVYECY